jgi:putative peptidoglycan lipid II flippase
MLVENVVQVISSRWRQLTVGSINRRIFGAMIIVGGTTLAVKLAALIKDLIVAASFGTGDAMDAFLIAFVIPTYLYNVVGGPFGATLTPVYIQVRENEGLAAARRLFSGAMALSIGLLTLVSVLAALIGPFLLPLLGSGFGVEKLALTRSLFYILLPTIVINGLTDLWGSAAYAGERFLLSSFASIAVPIATMMFLLAFGRAWSVYALAFGIVAGFLLQLCPLGWALRREGLNLWPRWYGFEPAIRRVIGQYLPVTMGAVLLSSTALIDQAMAAMLHPGSVAALSYGSKVVALFLSIGSTAMGIAVLPYFSKMVAATNWSGVRHSLKTYSRLTVLVTLPIALFVIVFSEPIISLIYRRGAFTTTDAVVVSQIQAMYVLQVPFVVLSTLFVQLIFSLQITRILMWGTIISFILNIALNYLLMQLMGIAGIALSTSLIYAVSCGFLWAMLFGKLKQVSG